MRTAIEHKNTCPAPDVQLFVGARGDNMQRCRNCRQLALKETEAAAPVGYPTPAKPTEVAADLTAARFVCREHPYQAVNWKGTNCPECAEERDNRRPHSRARDAA